MEADKTQDHKRARERTPRSSRAQLSNANTKTIRQNFMLLQTDIELLEWVAEFLGSSKSEAVRTSIRTFVALMQAQERDMRRKENK